MNDLRSEEKQNQTKTKPSDESERTDVSFLLIYLFIILIF